MDRQDSLDKSLLSAVFKDGERETSGLLPEASCFSRSFVLVT